MGICVNVDPDDDMLVEGKTPDFSVSIQDSTATTISNTPTVISLQSFSANEGTRFLQGTAFVVILVLVLSGLFIWKRRRAS